MMYICVGMGALGVGFYYAFGFSETPATTKEVVSEDLKEKKANAEEKTWKDILITDDACWTAIKQIEGLEEQGPL